MRPSPVKKKKLREDMTPKSSSLVITPMKIYIPRYKSGKIPVTHGR